MHKLYLIILILLLSFGGVAQNRLGLTTGDYAGANGIIMNPASGINSKYNLDIQLAGAGLFIKNDYLFFSQNYYSMVNMLSESPDLPTFIDQLEGEQYLNGDLEKELKTGLFNTRIFGPSYLVNTGSYSYGFYSGVRASIMVKDFSYDAARLVYEHLDYPELYNINFKNEVDMHFELLNYVESGINYSRNIHTKSFETFDIGINLKYLVPHSGGKVFVDNIDYIIPNRDTAIVFDGNGKMKFSLPYNYNDDTYSNTAGFAKGHGLGADLGFVYTKSNYYQRRNQSGARYRLNKNDNYKYRIGFSILDLGYITFNKKVQSHDYKDVNVFWTGLEAYDYVSLNRTIEDISREFFGSPDASNTGATSFTMMLPTALSLQLDYHYYENWFVNSVVMYNINKKARGYNRPDYLALMPRYEKPHWGVGFPVALYNFKDPQIGINLRYYFLTVGTSNLVPTVGIANENNLDVYVSIKINFLKINDLFNNDINCHGFEYIRKSKRDINE